MLGLFIVLVSIGLPAAKKAASANAQQPSQEVLMLALDTK